VSGAQRTALVGGATVDVGGDRPGAAPAAGAGCPTVAVLGPTDPRLWGPGPQQGLAEPWRDAGENGAAQRRGNVVLVQNALPCMPCQLEGCERRLESDSACLLELSAETVIEACEIALQTNTY